MGKMKKIPRQEMPLLDMEARRTSFKEVALGYTEEQAVAEAKRCIPDKFFFVLYF